MRSPARASRLLLLGVVFLISSKSMPLCTRRRSIVRYMYNAACQSNRVCTTQVGQVNGRFAHFTNFTTTDQHRYSWFAKVSPAWLAGPPKLRKEKTGWPT